MDIKPTSVPAAGLPSLHPVDPGPITETKNNFSSFISTSVKEVNNSQIEADGAIEKLHSGEAQNLHDVMIAVEKADLSLRMLVQIRNKALTAYDEIMRMQI